MAFTTETPTRLADPFSVGSTMALALTEGTKAAVQRPTRKVSTRQLAPPPAEEFDPTLLYRQAPQIVGEVPMRVSFMEVTPEQARDWIHKADADPEFRQRPTYTRDVRRWRILLETKRFVHYLPDSPLCFDETGLLLNGKHRLTAVAGRDEPVGFMVVRRCPRWMFHFFDTGRGRSLKDVFTIASRATKTQTGSIMRLAMRYEEFISGIRPANSWREWPRQRDENFDVDDFLSRRADLQDTYPVGQRIYGGAKLIIASATVFRYYQQLAWPEGAKQLESYCESLASGADLRPASAPLMLREWSKDSFNLKERIEAKREIHTILLFRHFQLAVQGDKVSKVSYWNGMPMAMPYHPDGPETAVANVRAALVELDRA